MKRKHPESTKQSMPAKPIVDVHPATYTEAVFRKSAKESIAQPKQRRLWPIIIALLVGLGLGAGGIIMALYIKNKPTPPVVPDTIRKQINFSILAPSLSDGYSLDSFAYDSSAGVLSFMVRGPEAVFTVTEQATPENFSEIPEYYDKLVESLLEYKRFESEIGRVSLTKPKEFGGQQAGVINAKGTLMFARPDKELSDDAWRTFYSRIQTLKDDTQ